jgi:hypothetical protein
MPAPLLVIGIGNPSRGDDALGPLFIERAEILAGRRARARPDGAADRLPAAARARPRSRRDERAWCSWTPGPPRRRGGLLPGEPRADDRAGSGAAPTGESRPRGRRRRCAGRGASDRGRRGGAGGRLSPVGVPDRAGPRPLGRRQEHAPRRHDRGLRERGVARRARAGHPGAAAWLRSDPRGAHHPAPGAAARSRRLLHRGERRGARGARRDGAPARPRDLRRVPARRRR